MKKPQEVNDEAIPMDPAEGGMSKAERLLIAGSVASSVRSAADRNQFRRVTVVDRNDPSKIVGYTTLAKVQEAALETAKIEIAVDEGVRPKKIICRHCGRPTSVKQKGMIPVMCVKCLNPPCVSCGVKIPKGGYSETARCSTCHFANIIKPLAKCADCGAKTSRSASHPGYRKRKDGIVAAVRCWKCEQARRFERAPKCPKCGDRIGSHKSRTCKRCFQPKPRLRCTVCNDILQEKAGTPSAIAKRKGAPPRCWPCFTTPKPLATCAVCGVTLAAHATRPSVIKTRNGAPPRCGDCSRHQKQALPPI